MDKRDGVPNRSYPPEFRVEALRLAQSVGVTEAAKRLRIPQSSLGNWIRSSRRGEATVTGKVKPSGAATEKSELEAENARLRRELANAKLDLEIVKKSGGVFREGVAVKYAWIEQHRDSFSVSRMCRQLGISRSGYCQWRMRFPSTRSCFNAVLDARVEQTHVNSRGAYGRCRVLRILEEDGIRVGHERTRQSQKRQGLRPAYKRPYRVATDSSHARPIAPNLLGRRFDGWKTNQAWVADITYIGTGEGWLYLACVMDLASRRIVGWSMSERITADLVCQAVKSAYWKRKPPPGLIMHSDRGSQYASRSHRQIIDDFKMQQSMSRRANCWDNSAMDSFFKSLKVECVYQRNYENRGDARLDIVEWIEGFYNRRRIHSALEYKTPSVVEELELAA